MIPSGLPPPTLEYLESSATSGISVGEDCEQAIEEATYSRGEQC